MITRKAIIAAFEVITDDRDVKTVTYFIRPNDTLLSRIERVRITRVFKGKPDFRVTLGKCNYAERAYIGKLSRAKKRIPTILTTEFKRK